MELPKENKEKLEETTPLVVKRIIESSHLHFGTDDMVLEGRISISIDDEEPLSAELEELILLAMTFEAIIDLASRIVVNREL